MSKYFLRIALVAFLALAGYAPVAFAQDTSQIAGQWRCQFSMQPFNKQPLDTHYWEFQIGFQPNGQYQMQGFYYSPSLGYNVPVSGQGQWGMTNGPNGQAVSVQGQLFRQDAGWSPFQFMVNAASAQQMYFQFKGNTHFTNIVCQR